MSTIIYFLNNNSSAIEAVSTAVLVMVTIYYAIQSRKTVVEITKQRQDNLLPLIIAESFEVSFVHGSDNCCIEAVLKNIGKGPAFNLLVEFFDAETQNQVISSNHYLPYLYYEQKDTLHIHVPKDEINNLRFQQKEKGPLVTFLVCSIKFEDIYKRKIETKANFSYEKKSSVMKPMLGDFEFSFIDL